MAKKNNFKFFCENLNTWNQTSWGASFWKLRTAYLLKFCVIIRGYHQEESCKSLRKDRIIWGLNINLLSSTIMLSFDEIWMWNMNNSYKAKKLQKWSV